MADSEDKKPEKGTEAEADDGRRDYALRPGKTHSIIDKGGRRPLNPGETVRLNPGQYEAFKDKFLPVAEYADAKAAYDAEVPDTTKEVTEGNVAPTVPPQTTGQQPPLAEGQQQPAPPPKPAPPVAAPAESKPEAKPADAKK